MQYDSKVVGRFWRQVVKTETCWNWTGYRGNKFGHGQIRSGNTHLHVHRLSWHLHNGAIPKGMCVLHECDNPKCVNPDHLFLGTKGDNHRDMVRKGRHSLGERNAKSKLNEVQVKEIRAKMGVDAKDLGVEYGVSRDTIYKIRNRETWKYLA